MSQLVHVFVCAGVYVRVYAGVLAGVGRGIKTILSVHH